MARAVRLELEEYTEKNEIIASQDRKDKIMGDNTMLNLMRKYRSKRKSCFSTILFQLLIKLLLGKFCD